MPDAVPFLDVRRLDEPHWPALEEAFLRVLRSGRYILGPEVEAFEAACARYLDVPHAIGVSSGTDALLLALMALGIGPGDDVVVPTYSFFATAGAVARLGARPVFCDVDARTFNAPAEAIADAITPRTRAIMPVHLFGQSADMEPILALAAERNIPVIEDAAQAIGASYQGRMVGGLGAFGCFSFYPTKNLGALGDAGLVVTRDDELAEHARRLRVHGDRGGYDHVEVGANFRIDAVQAAFLAAKLPHLEADTEARRRLARGYAARFADLGLAGRGPEEGAPRIQLPPIVNERHAFNQHVIRVRGRGARDGLKAFLAARGVGSAVYYPLSLHQQPCFSSLGHGEGAFPAAEQAARESLALPIHPLLEERDLDLVCEAIGAWLDEQGWR